MYRDEDSLEAISTGNEAGRMQFYLAALKRWIPDPDASILIVGAGRNDFHVMRAAGFENLAFSNLDDRYPVDAFSPYRLRIENAESILAEDNTFDFVVEHDMLHHARRPHTALTEMYRVAKKGLIAIEARDSLTMRVSTALGVSPVYEPAAVAQNGGSNGGVANTGVANFIYRWTEREAQKTLASYDPTGPIETEFHYGWDAPFDLHSAPALKRTVLACALVPHRLLCKVVPQQGNMFAFFARKRQAGDPVFGWNESAVAMRQ